jgi:glycosyltransferase involved in cell wall biosynthesis
MPAAERHEPDRPSRAPLVLLTGRDPLRGGGGLETYARAHALAGASLGFDVHVFSLAPRTRRIATDSWTLHEVGTPVRPFATYMAAMHRPFVVRSVLDVLAGTPAKAPIPVHAFGPMSYVGIAVTRALGQRGVPTALLTSSYTTVRHEHEAMHDGLRREHGLGNAAVFHARLAWVRAVAERAERRGLLGSRLVLVNYRSVERLLLEIYPGVGEIRRIPYASDLAFIAPNAAVGAPELPDSFADAEAPLIVCVARHDPRKGVDRLLLALAGLREAGVRFRACLLGRGQLIGAHRAMAERLGLARAVWIPGQVPDVRPYLDAADLFVLPSLEEGSGSVALIEAMGAGLPVVASACDGIPEDVCLSAVRGDDYADGDAGLLVTPGDTDELRRAIATMLALEPLRARAGAAARSIYERRFSKDGFVEALGAIYDELAR